MNANPAMTKRSLRSAKKHENHIARSRGEIVGNVIILIILTLLALTTLLSYISFRSGRFRSLICGEPAIVVRYGKLQQRAMRHNRMTVDELLELSGMSYARAIEALTELEIAGLIQLMPDGKYHIV